MKLLGWGARCNPVREQGAGGVRLPAQRPAAPTPRQAAAATTPAPPPPPRQIIVPLTHPQADDLPLWIPRLLALHDVRPGDHVTVDLADLGSVHLTA